MFFRQYYLACLSHASYLIGDTTTGQAVVVDPQRDIAEYLADAEAHGLSIVKVLETHSTPISSPAILRLRPARVPRLATASPPPVELSSRSKRSTMVSGSGWVRLSSRSEKRRGTRPSRSAS